MRIMDWSSDVCSSDLKKAGAVRGAAPASARRSDGSCVLLPFDLLVVADHLVDDEAQEFLAELGVEVGLARQATQPLDLPRLAAGVGGGQVDPRFQLADRLRHLEAFGEHIDERGVDIVDALAVTAQLVVHRAGGSSCSRHAWHRDGGTGKPKVVAKIGQIGRASCRERVCQYV